MVHVLVAHDYFILHGGISDCCQIPLYRNATRVLFHPCQESKKRSERCLKVEQINLPQAPFLFHVHSFDSMLCYVFVVCLLCIFTGTLHDTHVLLVHVHVTASLDWFFKSPHLANYLRELLSCQGNRFCCICSGKIHFTDNGNYFQFCGCDWNIRFS